MNTAATIARFVLGLVFVVFGLNGFLNFIPMGPVPALAGQFAAALIQSHYMVVVLTLEILSGLLLVTNNYGLLATTFIAPVIVNILLFHLLMALAGLPLALVVTVLWIVVFLSVRSAFAGLLQQRVQAQT